MWTSNGKWPHAEISLKVHLVMFVLLLTCKVRSRLYTKIHTCKHRHTLFKQWAFSNSFLYLSIIHKAWICHVYLHKYKYRHAFSTRLYTSVNVHHSGTHTHTQLSAHTQSKFIWWSHLPPCQAEAGPELLSQCSRFKHIYFTVGGWHKKAIRTKTKSTWALAELSQPH